MNKNTVSQNLQFIYEICATELPKFSNWTLANRLTLNVQKTFIIPHHLVNLNHDDLCVDLGGQSLEAVVVVAGGVSRLVYTPGGGSGGGLGSCISKGGRLSKEGRAAMCRATSTGRAQRSSTERPVGASPQSNK